MNPVDRQVPRQSWLLASAKRFMVFLGARMSQRMIYGCESILNHLKLGRWLQDHQIRFPKILRSREDVFVDVAQRVRDHHVLYLEFGVFQGAATRIWSRELRNPKTRLHGFDSFEGLPEEFGPYSKGHFSTRGSIPQIDDPRVQFFKGWFNESLASYTVPPHDVLVLNLDADLYSSTIFVLDHLRPWIKAGTLVYLDDMSLPDHEGRAFAEFQQKTGLKFRPLCADRTLRCQFYECVG